MSVTFSPIGKIRIKNNRYFIEVKKELFEATKGLEDFSHIQVIWWLNQYDTSESRVSLVMDSPYKKAPEKLGVFATRSPIRPNPIAITACKLLSINEDSNMVEIAYIDAMDETPVLDIKAYHPSVDIIRDVKMPKWCEHWPKCSEESATFAWDKEFNF
ncbi:tRNA (N6-threonylcarbamoyladenosine(37)-N6)-methyltransferase TrmO [Clostridiaceae bacterium M8S5]|nr:tRNA (N6-threonylcarbamoyladenosine(37)-N6)-methyltransferase TrmO [Clostridiaceae bacterium M8S5]